MPEFSFGLPPDAVNISGNSNDVWNLGSSILTVCWRADRDRILREAALYESLPPEIPHPAGPWRRPERRGQLDTDGTCRGVRLSDVMLELPGPEQREVFRHAARLLGDLHSWDPPPSIRMMLGERPTLDPTVELSVWAADVMPLPIWRIDAIANLAKELPFVDAGLVDAVVALIKSLADPDPLELSIEDGVVLHSDFGPFNVLIQDGEIAAVIDFEWSRIGPRDLDLTLPYFLAQFDEIWGGDGPDRLPFLECFEEDYPELLAAPELDRRQWLYGLCLGLRTIVWWPPSGPEETLKPDHPIHMLRRLLEGPLLPRRSQ
jgi:hypothetical protein